MNGTVYVLVIDAEDADLMAGHSFEVADEALKFDLKMMTVQTIFY